MKNFFTSLYNSLSDPKSYYSFQKEMQLKAMEQTFFNSFAGKGSFRAVVLPEDIGAPDALKSQSTGTKGIRIRPLDIHDFILPEPCSASAKHRKKLIAMHPVAYPDSTFPIAGGNIEQSVAVSTGMIVNCKFSQGPQGGKLRGITYTKTNSYSNNLNLSCFGNVQEKLKAAFEGNDVDSVGNVPGTGRDPATNVSTATAKAVYDDVDIPNKDINKQFFEEEMHKDFVPFVKQIVAEAWREKQIKVKFNSTFRTVGYQKVLRDAWDEWIKTLPADKRGKIKSKRDWVNQGKPGGEPPPKNIVVRPATPGHSNHNFGTALDCSITVGGKSYSASNSKAQWESTGWPEIVKSYGLRWGGDWNKYDPVHIDLNISKSVKGKIRSATMDISNKKQAITEINKINIFE